MAMTKILVVCLGNICRSPAAQIVLDAKAKAKGFHWQIDSAATGRHTQGQSPDPRSIKIGHKRGYDLSHLQARTVTVRDFFTYSHIFAMDNQNLTDLQKLYDQALRQNAKSDTHALATLALFDDKPVPDPYYGDMADFESMYDQLERASIALVDTLG